MERKQGISLVALIITIIVLIILTGAVIMTMNKGDTIGKSKEAVFKSDLSNYREEVSRNILNEQVKGNVASMKDVTVIPSDENYATEIKKYIPNITSDYMGKLGIKEGNLYYVDKADEEKFGLAAELNMVDITDTFAGNPGLKVGDYIKYTPGAGTYIATSERTGYGTQGYIDWSGDTPANVDQTFTSTDEEEIWRVLSIDGANVTIVRGEPTTNLVLFGELGNNNVIEELNNICKIYKNGTQAKEARSITIEEINKVTNYTQAEMNNFNGGSREYGYVSPEINGRTYTSDYYYYAGTRNEKMINTSNEYTMIFKNNANSSTISYWVASRCVNADSDYAYFDVRGVRSGEVGANYLYCTLGDERSEVLGVRPVVVLKPTVSVADGSGTAESPWKLQ